jgi:hypothetical protein
VSPETGAAAAWSEDRLAALGVSLSVRAHAYVANEPSQIPNMASPALKPVASAPTASIVPARLCPGLRYFGPRSPNPARWMGYGRPALEVVEASRSDSVSESQRDRNTAAGASAASRIVNRRR